MTGIKGLIVGVANEHSIAWGCAKILHEGILLVRHSM